MPDWTFMGFPGVKWISETEVLSLKSLDSLSNWASFHSVDSIFSSRAKIQVHISPHPLAMGRVFNPLS